MKRGFVAILLVLSIILASTPVSALVANTCTSTTATVTGTDPSFVVTHKMSTAAQGVVVYVKYAKGSETGITMTFEVINPSLSATDEYSYYTLSGTALGAQTITQTATGNYRIVFTKIESERTIIVNVVFGSATQSGAVVVNFNEY